MKRLFASFALSACAVTVAHAQFPDRPVKITVPVPPAGIIDQVVRIVAGPLATELGQTVVVENRPGASGNIAASYVARSKPDGYALLAGYSMFHVGNPVMFSGLDWDPVKDFAPIAMLVVSPHIVAVHPGVPVDSLKELVAYAKANPGKLNYATSGNGSVPHIGVEMFKQSNQIDIVHVPYKGAGPAVQDLLGGNVQMTVATPPSVASFVSAGKLKGLAVASKSRLDVLPDVPTTAEAGFPNFELEAWVALFAPSGTPPDVVKTLSEAVKTSLESSAAQKSLTTLGVEVRYMDPAGLAKTVKDDIAYWQPVIKKAGIKVD